MKKIFFLSFFFIFSCLCAQTKNLWDERIDSLKTIYQEALKQAPHVNFNYAQDSLFVKIIVRMLNTENSYKQNWDSLSECLICLTTPDDKIKIISWKFPIPGISNIFSYRGVIQLKNNIFIPLFDGYAFSDDRKNYDGYTSPKNWFGAVYYHILQLDKKENIYTLFGLRQDDIFSDKKVIEVIRLEGDHVTFGGDFQLGGIDTAVFGISNTQRFVISCKKGISTTLQYEKNLKRIIFDQFTTLESESNSNIQKNSYSRGIANVYIPDGHYLGLKYGGNGTWFFAGNIINFLKMKE